MSNYKSESPRACASFCVQVSGEVGREEAVSLESSRVLAAVCIPVTHVAVLPSPGFTIAKHVLCPSSTEPQTVQTSSITTRR